MDLSAAAIAEWHALMPADLKAVIPNDASTNWDRVAARLVADLTPDSSDIADTLVRHAGTIADFGSARRARMLAWIAMRTWCSGTGLVEILAQERLASLRPTVQRDLEALAGVALARPNRTFAVPSDACLLQLERPIKR